MKHKRQVVLYVVGAIAVLLILFVLVMANSDAVSDTPQITQQATSSGVVGSSSGRGTVAPSAATTSPFLFEIATTAAARERGLSGRQAIESNYGMLFVFPEKGKQGFWMKEMNFPIDILWIADDGTVRGIEDSVSPATYPNVFYSPEPVRYVLETKAGEARRLGIQVGTKLTLPLPYR